jgi:hypothetical protein
MKRFIPTIVILLMLCNNKVFPGITVENGLSHIYHLSKGERSTADVKIHNNSSAEQYLEVFITDYRTNADGESFFSDPGSHSGKSCQTEHLIPV